MQTWHVIFNGRPSISSAIDSAVIRALDAVRRNVLIDEFTVREKILDSLRRVVYKRKEVAEYIGERFTEILKG